MKYIRTRKQAKSVALLVSVIWTVLCMQIMYFLGRLSGYYAMDEISDTIVNAIGIMSYPLGIFLIGLISNKLIDRGFPKVVYV